MTRKEAIEILDDGAWWNMVDIMLPCDGAANKALHDAVDIHYSCSICGYKVGGMTSNYCPNCGAKMDTKG